MASNIEHRIVHADKLAVFTCNDEIDERQIRFYVIHNWETLTQGMDNSTILFIAGVHGDETGKLGPNEDIQTMKNQFNRRVLKHCESEWILEEKEKRNIKFEFLAIPDFYIKEETKHTKSQTRSTIPVEVVPHMSTCIFLGCAGGASGRLPVDIFVGITRANFLCFPF